MNCLKRKHYTIPHGRFCNIFQIMILYGITLFMPAVSLAKTPCTVGSILKNPASPIGKCGLALLENNPNCDTIKKVTSSYYEKYQHLINTGRIPFFGTWADYFSCYLRINRDSSFNFSWGFNGRSCWTTGKWERIKDTFLFYKKSGL